MNRSALGMLAVLIATASPARADDPNRWQGWVTPADGQDNGVDVSMVTADASTCGKRPQIALQSRYHNRYQERVAGRLKIDHESAAGPRSVMVDFDLQPGETKVIASATFCHDARRSLVFVIAELRFPDRDAERDRVAAQKAAADKAAADRAAAQKAEREKAAAEQAAVEAARREQAKQQAEQLAKQSEATRARDAAARRASERELAAQRDEQLAAARYREKRQAEAQVEAGRNTPLDEPVTDQPRHGEVSLQAPIGFQSTQYASGTEGRFSYGLRAEARLFAWLNKPPGKPHTGLELKLGGGIATTRDLGSRASDSKTNVGGGYLHARFWHGSFGAGVFGEWTHHSHSPGSGSSTETYDLFALGPELAFGIVAGRAIAIEASGRVGAVASGGGLTASATQDLFMAASVMVGLDKLFGGAFATRYLTSGGIESSWNAMGVVGVRLPF